MRYFGILTSIIAMKEDTKSLRFPEETDKKLTKLADKLGHSKRDLFIQMVDYFDKSKKDPADLNDDLLKKDISQGINRIISFIKTQEKDTLAPMLAEVREDHQAVLLADRRQIATWNKYGVSWDKHRSDWTTFQKSFADLFRMPPPMALSKDKPKPEGYLGEEFTSLHQEVSNLRSETKQEMASLRLEARNALLAHQTLARREEALKTGFTTLLENYIAQRDKLNSLTNAKVIDQLQKDTLERIQKL
jgi:hypothetical protein